MKRINNIYDQINSFENIHNAYLKAKKGKCYKKEVLEFSARLEENLIEIHNELQYGSYKTGTYKKFKVYDPKERLILALPFKDRVVHHALNNIIEPIFDSKFIFDSYACRKNKGSIAAMKRLRKFIDIESIKGEKVYYLKADVAKYFYSIDHDVLKALVRRKIKCQKTLALIDNIIDSTENPGIPIGNLSSQLFANIYLDALDHKIKDDWGIKSYVRYMDDFIILSKSKSLLRDLLYDIYFILKKLKLNFNKKTRIDTINRGIDFVGYRLFASFTLLRKRIYRKNTRKFKKFSRLYLHGNIEQKRIRQSIDSLLGICKHCQSFRARENILKNLVLCHG